MSPLAGVTALWVAAYDGLMLGSFVAAAADVESPESYGFLRSRIAQYFSEHRMKIDMPVNHDEYSGANESWNKKIWQLSAAISPEVHQFCIAGSMAYYALSERDPEPDLAGEVQADLKTTLASRPEFAGLVHEFLSTAPPSTSATPYDDRLSHVLYLTRRCLEAMPKGEDQVAFVSMPFKPPFPDRYNQLYLPLLAKLGYQGFRAWGGLALENYWDLLLTLIGRSKIVLADLTGHNPNVMHEVGLAEGMDNTVLMVAEKGFQSPSNLNYHAIIAYDPMHEGWPASSIAATEVLLRAALAGRDRRLARERTHRRGA
jgi:hypothetical protein